jgi:hypothetical protein
MKLLLAKLLMRIRGPINVSLFGKDVLIEGEPVLIRAHRRYVTVWSLWYDRKFDSAGNKVPYVQLLIHKVPWRLVDMVYLTLGGPKDD